MYLKVNAYDKAKSYEPVTQSLYLVIFHILSSIVVTGSGHLPK